MAKKITVVGAGVGGLAAAARLARHGCQVTVLEKLPVCGGRNHLLEDKGFAFDMGPSFVLMPELFEELFEYCGTSLSEYLHFKPLETHYKIFYPDGESLTVYNDCRRTKDELERLEKGSASGFDGFISETEALYKKIKPLLYQCFTASSLFDRRYWPLLKQLKVFESYWSLARKYFKSEKCAFAFTFEAMFMGVSPFKAPAFYSIITYADHVQKIFHPMGGMYQIPMALEKLASGFGAGFQYNTEVSGIKRIKDKLVCQVKGGEVASDCVIANADYAYTQSALLKRRLPRYQYSCSVYLMYMGLKKKIKGLAHHNLFFSNDLRKNLNQVFSTGEFPEDPSFYIHVPTVTDISLAPDGKDILYVLLPVPNLAVARRDMRQMQEKARRMVFKEIDKAIGENVQSLIEVEHAFYPQDFIEKYNIKYGATFGLAHNLMQSAFFRPANYDVRMPNLFYCGASTQPGGGLPVVIAGSRIVADLVLKMKGP